MFFCIENNDVSHETLCLLDFVEMDFAWVNSAAFFVVAIIIFNLMFHMKRCFVTIKIRCFLRFLYLYAKLLKTIKQIERSFVLISQNKKIAL